MTHSSPRISTSSSTRSLSLSKACARSSDQANAHLKIVLEAGELAVYDKVRHASSLAILTNVDCIKDLDQQDPTGHRDASHLDDAGDRARLT